MRDDYYLDWDAGDARLKPICHRDSVVLAAFFVVAIIGAVSLGAAAIVDALLN
jgi:hypothetical protein